MKLDFKNIYDAGDISRERIVLVATEDLDIGKHILMATRLTTDRKDVLGGFVPECYWLPDQKVVKGDQVIVYTKGGKESSKKNAGGFTSYFFYWGLKTPVWVQRKAAIAEALRWKGFVADPEKSTEEPAPG